MPSISINVDTVYLSIPTPVQFNDNSAIADTWYWEFGDSTNSTIQNPVHNYDSTGSYTIILIASYGICSDTTYALIVVLDSSTSIVHLQQNEVLKLYPNPVNTEVVVETSEKLIVSELAIYDLRGQLLITKQFDKGAIYELTVSVEGLTKGVYFIRINSDAGSVVKKFIKF